MKRRLADIKHRIRAADHDEDEIEELELFIFDEISSFFGVSAEKVSELLARHPNAKSVLVHINSPGGNALDGVAIYNALQRHKAPVEVIVEGMALSAASLIAMAGDTIKMAAGSQMMIHEARGMAHGTAAEVAKFADLLKATSTQMAEIYSARSGRDLATVKREMKAETFMTAEEAVERGFATEVLEAKALAAHFDLSEFVNDKDRIPAALIELTEDSGVRLESVLTIKLEDALKDIVDADPGDVWMATKEINDLPDAAFAIVVPGGEKDDEGKTTPRSLRKLPHHTKAVKNASDNDTLDLPRLRNALARINQTDLTESQRATAQKHLDKHADAVLPSRQESKDSPPLGGDNGAMVAPTPIAVMAGFSPASLVSDFGRKSK